MDKIRESGVPSGRIDRTWVEVSRTRLENNLSLIRRNLAPGARVYGVVKANAYGHGMDSVAEVLADAGLRDFAVADVREGIRLRRRLAGEARILVLGGCDPGWEGAFRTHDLTAAWFDRRPVPPGIRIQVKVDTGMGRLGIPAEELRDFLRGLAVPVAGIFSTLSSADTDPVETRRQIERFRQVTQGLDLPRHLANSSGLLYPEAHFDAVRPGLAIYGVRPTPHPVFDGLLPALVWKASVLTVSEKGPGSGIGYSRTYVTTDRRRIGILGVGYADGFSRAFSNAGQVLTSSGPAPVVGRVSMDLTAIDLSAYPGVQAGDSVILLDSDAASPLSAQALARRLGTIPYEVLTWIGPRVPRYLVE